MQKHDPALDTLLELDGITLIIEPRLGYWVRFVVNRVPATSDKPHGLGYSLTLHAPNGERIVGFDNAHRIAGQRLDEPQDHRHRVRTVKPYEYRDAATLLIDFWTEGDRELKEKGVAP